MFIRAGLSFRDLLPSPYPSYEQGFPNVLQLRLLDNHLFLKAIIIGKDWGIRFLFSEFIYPKGPHHCSFYKTVCIRFPCILFHYILFNTYYGLSFMKDVSSNHLGALGCQWMCDMIQNNVSLLKIDLSDNGFNDKDTVFLLDALKVQTSVIDWFAFLRQTANINHLWHVTTFSLYMSSLVFICSFSFLRISQILNLNFGV